LGLFFVVAFSRLPFVDARSIPLEKFHATIEPIAPVALQNITTGHNHLLVDCPTKNPNDRLDSGMTGCGRASRGRNTMGMMWLTKGVRYLLTRFWWQSKESKIDSVHF
jgi:hypothetical protein